jgi:adenylosuccinate synthase
MTRFPIEPLYQHFKGWNQVITGITEEAALPRQMKEYVQFINGKLGVPVRYISNGPGRDQIIKTGSAT